MLNPLWIFPKNRLEIVVFFVQLLTVSIFIHLFQDVSFYTRTHLNISKFSVTKSFDENTCIQPTRKKHKNYTHTKLVTSSAILHTILKKLYMRIKT